ncbi:MAG: hypothetical protein J5I90_18035 [Caldilineales bacterium]|nr:hypothetical protein [Caldilineales bacterium]
MQIGFEEQTAEKLQPEIHRFLAGWGGGAAAGSLGKMQLVRQAARQRDLSSLQAVARILVEGIDELASRKPEQAQILRLRFLDGLAMHVVANRINRSEPAAYKLQRKALRSLTDIIYRQELALKAGRNEAIFARLGAPEYDRLFGIDELLSNVMELVQSPSQPWLILLEGIGGIGKTSLADALVRKAVVAGVVEHVGWVTARRQIFRLSGRIDAAKTPTLTTAALVENLANQILRDTPLPVPFTVEQVLPLLRQRLNEEPHLIVVDNLETVVDLETLLPALRLLARHSKILLTSRRSLLAEAHLYHCQIPELSPESAFALLRHEAQLRNVHALAAADDDALHAIYATVGGNPLALRLVAGQTLVHDLPSILVALTNARGESASQLYNFIYRNAWDSLDEIAQRTLLVMPLAPPQGLVFPLLAQTSGLAESELYDALDRLVRLNLIDRRGDLENGRYSIHPLTQSFLQEQVLRWK